MTYEVRICKSDLHYVYVLSSIKQMAQLQHSMKVASRRSGLSTHVIRVWEKRYEAVSPHRTKTNRRLYSDEEIERLTLLRLVTEAGHSIGNIARLPMARLRKLAEEALPSAAPGRKASTRSASDVIEAAVEATKNLNAAELEEILGRAAVAHGQHGLLENIISPFAVKIGDLWREGVITAANEHFASAVIRNFLIRNSKGYALNGNAPTLVVGTPAGQLHEIGAVMAAAAANDMGWRVVYLGTSLPAVEIAGAVVQNKARAVALSVVFPGDDANLPAELENLRKHLPPEIKIIVGGRAAESYLPTLQKIGAVHARELRELYAELERLRMPAA
jgi:methylmalonyl-CoA mutase cobalamin-binding domain/chain